MYPIIYLQSEKTVN